MRGARSKLTHGWPKRGYERRQHHQAQRHAAIAADESQSQNEKPRAQPIGDAHGVRACVEIGEAQQAQRTARHQGKANDDQKGAQKG